MVIGLTLGLLVAKIGIPSFVVTLAAFLAFQGVALLLIERRHQHLGPRQRPARRRQPQPAARAGLGAGRARGGRVRASAADPAPAPLHPRPDHRSARRRLVPDRRTGPDPRRGGVHPQPGAQPQRADRLAQGRAGGGADHRRAPGGLDLRAHPHRVRPAHLRGGRQPGGGPAGRHQRRPHPRLLLPDLLQHGRGRRHRRGQPGQLRRRRTPAAATCCSTRSGRP